MQVIKKNYVKPAQKDENAEVSGVKMTTHISQLINTAWLPLVAIGTGT